MCKESKRKKEKSFISSMWSDQRCFTEKSDIFFHASLPPAVFLLQLFLVSPAVSDSLSSWAQLVSLLDTYFSCLAAPALFLLSFPPSSLCDTRPLGSPPPPAASVSERCSVKLPLFLYNSSSQSFLSCTSCALFMIRMPQFLPAALFALSASLGRFSFSCHCCFDSS